MPGELWLPQGVNQRGGCIGTSVSEIANGKWQMAKSQMATRTLGICLIVRAFLDLGRVLFHFGDPGVVEYVSHCFVLDNIKFGWRSARRR